jgi:hypothetical protein
LAPRAVFAVVLLWKFAISEETAGWIDLYGKHINNDLIDNDNL